MPPGVGALTEGDGRNFMALMDMSRFIVNEMTQEHDFKDVQDASRLRCERMDLAAALTAKMWSFWHSAPGVSSGVYERLLGWCKGTESRVTSLRRRELGQQPPMMTAALHALVLNELKAWPRQRVTGEFLFARETSDGAALLLHVGPDAQPAHKVYKVLGISTSLGDMLRSNSQFGPPPLRLFLTLLPFMGAIVYDGTLRGKPLSGTGEVYDHAGTDAIIDDAVAAGSVIASLPAPADAPLEGKPVRISGLVARPELNGLIATAGDFDESKARYAVRLSDGTRLAIKPANLAEVSAAEAQAAAPAGTAVGSELTPWQREVQAELQAIRPMQASGDASVPGPDGAPADLSVWVCRRAGYTERQNPEHTFMVMAGPMPIPACPGPPIRLGMDPMMAMMMSGLGPEAIWHKASALVPTVDDILRALSSALKNPMWGGRGKPANLAVDAKEIVDRLREILKPAGIHVGYYPPPSNEELMTIPGGDVGGGV